MNLNTLNIYKPFTIFTQTIINIIFNCKCCKCNKNGLSKLYNNILNHKTSKYTFTMAFLPYYYISGYYNVSFTTFTTFTASNVPMASP